MLNSQADVKNSDVRISMKSATYASAAKDIVNGLFSFSTIWQVLGWLDIKQRYRRSVIGPFWLTLSTLIMVGALGLVYSTIFNQPILEYLPYVAAGLIVWAFISTMLTESCSAYTAAEGMIKQVKMPLSVHVIRMVWRNVIIFIHNAVILLACIFLGEGFSFSLLSIPLAVLIIALNGVWIGLILGALCTRFRDISQIVINFTQLVFFVTPIFWKAEAVAGREWIVHLNPIYHYIEIIRTPILKAEVPFDSWIVVIAMTALFGVLALFVHKISRHRIAYWV